MNYTISSGGTCVPRDKTTLFTFKLVQNEANRFLDALNKSLLACDGKLGKNTLAAVNGVGSRYPTTGLLGKTTTSCREIADNPGGYAVALKTLADQNKLAMPACPKGIIQKITHPEPVVQIDGSVTYDSPATAGVGGIPYWAIALVGVGGLYYLKKKGKI
jgi:hypothetical protein